jgi:hypothetical protein
VVTFLREGHEERYKKQWRPATPAEALRRGSPFVARFGGFHLIAFAEVEDANDWAHRYNAGNFGPWSWVVEDKA